MQCGITGLLHQEQQKHKIAEALHFQNEQQTILMQKEVPQKK